MTAKEFLRGIQGHEKRIKALLERKQDYYDMAMQGTGRREAMRIGGSSYASRVENAVCKLMELEADIDKEIDRLVDETRLARQMINELPDRKQQDVLNLRYFNNWSWEKIAKELNYDRSWVLKLHGEGLVNIKLPKNLPN